jgi:ABC-type nitrate/sulfonate/bicarbonate transport system substrate-binding protein
LGDRREGAAEEGGGERGQELAGGRRHGNARARARQKGAPVVTVAELRRRRAGHWHSGTLLSTILCC